MRYSIAMRRPDSLPGLAPERAEFTRHPARPAQTVSSEPALRGE